MAERSTSSKRLSDVSIRSIERACRKPQKTAKVKFIHPDEVSTLCTGGSHFRTTVVTSNARVDVKATPKSTRKQVSPLTSPRLAPVTSTPESTRNQVSSLTSPRLAPVTSTTSKSITKQASPLTSPRFASVANARVDVDATTPKSIRKPASTLTSPSFASVANTRVDTDAIPKSIRKPESPLTSPRFAHTRVDVDATPKSIRKQESPLTSPRFANTQVDVDASPKSITKQESPLTSPRFASVANARVDVDATTPKSIRKPASTLTSPSFASVANTRVDTDAIPKSIRKPESPLTSPRFAHTRVDVDATPKSIRKQESPLTSPRFANTQVDVDASPKSIRKQESPLTSPRPAPVPNTRVDVGATSKSIRLQVSPLTPTKFATVANTRAYVDPTPNSIRKQVSPPITPRFATVSSNRVDVDPSPKSIRKQVSPLTSPRSAIVANTQVDVDATSKSIRKHVPPPTSPRSAPIPNTRVDVDAIPKSIRKQVSPLTLPRSATVVHTRVDVAATTPKSIKEQPLTSPRFSPVANTGSKTFHSNEESTSKSTGQNNCSTRKTEKIASLKEIMSSSTKRSTNVTSSALYTKQEKLFAASLGKKENASASVEMQRITARARNSNVDQRAYLPALNTIDSWLGVFKLFETGDIFRGFEAIPPIRVAKTVYKLIDNMPDTLEVELLPRSYFLQDCSESNGPDLQDIALYIFPATNSERAKQENAPLFELLETRNSVMRCKMDDAELLISTSKQLPIRSESFIKSLKGSDTFLWGIFHIVKNEDTSSSPMECAHHNSTSKVAAEIADLIIITHKDIQTRSEIPCLDSTTDSGNVKEPTTTNVEHLQPDIPCLGSTTDTGNVKEPTATNVEHLQLEIPCLGSTTDLGNVKESTTANVKHLQLEIPCLGSTTDSRYIKELTTTNVKHLHREIPSLGSTTDLRNVREPTTTNVKHLHWEYSCLGGTTDSGNVKEPTTTNVKHLQREIPCLDSTDSGNVKEPTTTNVKHLQPEIPCLDSTTYSKNVKEPTTSNVKHLQPHPVNAVTKNMRDLILHRAPPPTTNWVKLNVEGNTRGNPSLTGAGGVIRDESGNWVIGYILNLHIATRLSAELWAIFNGLKLLWDRGYEKVMVEVAFPAALSALEGKIPVSVPERQLITSCKDLLKKRWETKICLISSERNSCARCLANNFTSHQLGMTKFESPPDYLLHLLQTDCIQVGAEDCDA